jgi:peptide/nickel transport system ATP-binding protein
MVLTVDDLHLEASRADGRAAPVLRGVHLHVREGAIHGLIGESGAGKSLLCRAILGLLPPRTRLTGGRIGFRGRRLDAMAPRERRGLLGREICFVPQDPMSSLNPAFRIGDQMGAALAHALSLGRGQARVRAADLLERVHIDAPDRVLRLYPHELSGGMRQRVLIALAFAATPRLVIADEPTTALDVTVQREILRLLRELQSSDRVAVLFVSHDLGVVSKVCDDVSVIHSGRILESGPVAQVYAAPANDYTRALFAATPRHDRPAARLSPVPDALSDALWAEAHAYDARRSG